MDALCLYVSVPVAGFRVAQAREYWETYLCPPPSTVYGMLLALVGESNRLVHQGAEIAIAMLGESPDISTVLRTMWRIKTKKEGPGLGNNACPDFQELMTGVKLAIWLRAGGEEAERSLYQRVTEAFATPTQVERYGGLCLGESTHLVDEIRPWRRSDSDALVDCALLLREASGHYALPVWPDHVGSKGTRWDQYRLAPQQGLDITQVPEAAWTRIERPVAA